MAAQREGELAHDHIAAETGRAAAQGHLNQPVTESGGPEEAQLPASWRKEG